MMSDSMTKGSTREVIANRKVAQACHPDSRNSKSII